MGGILGSAVRAARAGELRSGSPATWSRPSDEDLQRPFAADGSGWATERHAVAQLRRECADAGARLVLYDIGHPHAFSAEVERLAHAIGAGYNPAGRAVLQRAHAGEAVYLENDGHWTPLGNDLVARELAAILASQPAAP